MLHLQEEAREMAGRWGLPSPGTPSAFATNNNVWRCGDVWLKASSGNLSRRLREIDLLIRLDAKGFRRIPRILPTMDGALSIEQNGVLWTTESRLEGRHPDPDSIDDYARIGHGVVDIHAVMSEVEVDGNDGGFVTDLRHSLLHPPPVPEDLPAAARSAPALLRDALPWIEVWPCQTIHGDLSHPNILIADDGSCGFLDFEFASHDPPTFDLGVVATTLLVRSTLDGVARRDAWNGLLAASEQFQEGQILIAALARRWTALAANLRHSKPCSDVYRRQIRHLEVMVPMALAAFKAS